MNSTGNAIMTFCKIFRVTIMFGAILSVSGHTYGRILIIHSYHEQYDWAQGVNDGLLSHLESDVDHRFFYMDTKRRPDSEWRKEAAKNAKKAITEYDPMVVIAVDDNAQKYVVSAYTGRSPIQFVFCGVNADPEAYGYPSDNVTGILERAYPEQVFQMLKKIRPNVKRVAWISDDSPTARRVKQRVRKFADTRLLSLQLVNYEMPSGFKQWQNIVAKHNANPDIHALLIPLYHTVKNKKNGNSMLPANIMKWTAANTSKPIVGFWPFSTDDGALCAVAVDPYEHGKVAAFMAKQILEGKKASDIPIVTNQNGYVIVNLKSAERLAIDVPFAVLQSADKIIQ